MLFVAAHRRRAGVAEHIETKTDHSEKTAMTRNDWRSLRRRMQNLRAHQEIELKIQAATLAALVAVATSANAENKLYTIDSRHTFPLFEVSHYGFSLQRGRFNTARGTITLDTQAQRGSIDVTIDAASIDMGSDEWDEQMRTAGFFDTARHPHIRFRADTLEFAGGQPVRAVGTLSLLGVEQPVTLQIDNFHCDRNRVSGKPTCGADATARLQRSRFGMTRSLPGIGDDVKVLIAIEAVEQARE
jgi:polyisoprenoid-binding protein YceI